MGTVLGVILGVAVLSSGIVVGALVSIHVTHQRASVAADLAALAAAAHGCAAAQRGARAHGAVSVSCFEQAGDAVVTVAMPAPPMLVRVATWTGQEAPAIASSSRAGSASPAAFE
ncbi:MAG: hypothetical protein ACO3UW_07260 [Candidatus Nanopelagicales bacterium]